MKVLSLLIPSYNMELYLQSCVESVLSVSGDLREILEVIVVNDGSKDGTSRLGHQYEEQFPGVVRVIDKPNGHYGSCLNAALPVAAGEYVKILDADDAFDTAEFGRFLSVLRDVVLRGPRPDVIVSDADIVDPDGNVVSKMRFGFGADGDIVPIEAVPMCQIRDLHHHVVTFRTGIFKEIDYRQTEGVSYTDTQYVIFPFLRVQTLMPYHHVIYRYLYGREGQSMTPDVLAKARIPVTIKIALDSIKLYNRNRSAASSDYNDDFVRSRIVDMMRTIYEWALLQAPLGVFDDVLREFDSNIRTSSVQMYDELSRFTIGKCKIPYIRIWREKQSSTTLRFRSITLLRNAYRKLFR